MNGKLIVVMHSIIYGFGICYNNPDPQDLSNAPDELNSSVASTAHRVKQLLTEDSSGSKTPDNTTA